MDKKEHPFFKGKWEDGRAWMGQRFTLTPIESQICLTGAAVVLLGALLLVALNWDKVLLAVFLSLCLCFAVLTFTSGVALLQEEIIERTVPLSIPFDIKNNNLPPITSYLTEETPLQRISPYHRKMTKLALSCPPPMTLKQKEVQKKGRAVRLKRDTIITSCGELLQYEIFRRVHALQVSLWHATHGKHKPKTESALSEEGVHEDPLADTLNEEDSSLAIGFPVHLSKMHQYEGESLWNIVSVNRFSVINTERLYWKTTHLFLPENTRPSLNYVLASPNRNHLGYNVQLSKSWFFDIRFTIVPVIPIEWHVPSITINLPEDDTANVVLVKYNIQMKAHFHRVTAGNRQTEELKRWAQGLLNQMKLKLQECDLGHLWEQRSQPVSTPSGATETAQPTERMEESSPVESPQQIQEPLPEETPNVSVAS